MSVSLNIYFLIKQSKNNNLLFFAILAMVFVFLSVPAPGSAL